MDDSNCAETGRRENHCAESAGQFQSGEIAQIFDEIESCVGKKFPREALQAGIGMKDEIVPDLLRIVADAVRDPQKTIAEEHFASLSFALLALAQFREKRAYPLMIEMFNLPEDTAYELVGDFLTEDLPRALACVCGGDISLIKGLIENPQAEEICRASGISSLVELVGTGDLSRDEVITYFAELFRGKLERKESFVWAELVYCAADLNPEEVYEDIKKAYDEGLIDPLAISPENVKESLTAGREAIPKNLERACRGLINDAVAEMEKWNRMWQSDEPPPEFPNLPDGGGTEEFFHRREDSMPEEEDLPIEPSVGAGIKVGRNDPCPCGSGKKFKKCCGKQ